MSVIQEVDITTVDITRFKRRFVGCIVLTADKKILLQQIVHAREFFPKNSVVTFGGGIEDNESPMWALVRELKEELGALVDVDDVMFLGAITEKVTDYSELIYSYFWHDKNNTITGCYEDEAKYFNNLTDVFNDPNVTDDVYWMLDRCKERNLIKRS